MTYTYDPTAYRRYFEHSFTYLAGFRRTAGRFADRPAVTDPASGRTWTYAELTADVDRLAAGLAAAGVRPGDVVTYQLYNSPEFARLYLATQAIGAVGSPVNVRLASGEVAHVLADSAPRVFVYDASLQDTVAEALRRSPHRPDVVIAVQAGEDLAALLPDGGEVPAPGRTVYDETTRLYTSGTTGMPKGVPLNSLVEVFSAHDVAMHFPLGPEDVTLNMTPWFHRGGLYSGGPNPAFYVGAQVVPLRVFDAGHVLDLTARHGLTFLIGAPTNLAMLAAAQEARPRDLSSLRGIVTMGAPLEREACLRYQTVLTERIFNGYGTTESFWNTFLRPADLPDHAGAAGRACTDDEVRVVAIGGGASDPVPKDATTVGEVIVRSPKAGYAYVNSPEQERAKFDDDGWIHLGDLATWDPGEFVTIVGRADDMLVSGGENVHPVQVEEALNELPGVADSLVVGVPDERWGRRVVAYVVRADPALRAADCEAHCRDHPMLSRYKRPRGYRFVDALPLTATGKKIHYRATEQAAADVAAGLFTEVREARMSFDSYEQLLFERRDHGVLLITINNPDKYNATDEQLHGELARVWREVDAAPDVRVAVVTGARKAFSAGGDLAMVERMAGDHARVSHMLKEMSELVYTIIDCEKPIISAINGVAVGAGVVVALLADVAIAAEDAKLGDGHVKLGVSAGDHAAIIWPLLAGMAKARYYLLTGEMVTGAEAEKLGMVAKALPLDEVLDEALRVADVLATGSQQAIRLTKKSLNNWLRAMGPTFDQSAAYEMLCFLGPDVHEGVAALREKRAPVWPSAL